MTGFEAAFCNLIEKGVQLSELGNWTWPDYLLLVLGMTEAQATEETEKKPEAIKANGWADVRALLTAQGAKV